MARHSRMKKAIASLLVVLSVVAIAGVIGYFIADLTRYQIVLTLKPSIPMEEKAYIHVSLMYPEGLREVSKAVIDLSRGEGKITVDLRDLKKAWDEEYRKSGTYAQPLIIVSGYTRSGKVFVQGINLFWNNLTGTANIALEPLEDVNVKKDSLNNVDYGEELEPLNGCWETRNLVDSYEQTRDVALAKVSPDSETWGTIDYSYAINRKVGFRVNVFIESAWTSAGFHIINKDSHGFHSEEFYYGEYYIWMKVTYRFEKWHVYGICDGEIIDYYEEYVYVKDFYPGTINGGTTLPSGAEMPPIDSWKDEGVHTSTESNVPYYKKVTGTWGSDSFAIDALKFIDVLTVLGKISGKAATAASIIGLFIDVNFVYENMEAFYFAIRFFSDSGISHRVYYGESYDYQWAPVLYFETYLAS